MTVLDTEIPSDRVHMIPFFSIPFGDHQPSYLSDMLQG